MDIDNFWLNTYWKRLKTKTVTYSLVYVRKLSTPTGFRVCRILNLKCSGVPAITSHLKQKNCDGGPNSFTEHLITTRCYLGTADILNA